MSPKIKSLLYFICFMVSAVIYHMTSEQEASQNEKETAELIKTDSENYVLQNKLFEDTLK